MRPDVIFEYNFSLDLLSKLSNNISNQSQPHRRGTSSNRRVSTRFGYCNSKREKIRESEPPKREPDVWEGPEAKGFQRSFSTTSLLQICLSNCRCSFWTLYFVRTAGRPHWASKPRALCDFSCHTQNRIERTRFETRYETRNFTQFAILRNRLHFRVDVLWRRCRCYPKGAPNRGCARWSLSCDFTRIKDLLTTNLTNRSGGSKTNKYSAGQ